MSERKRWLKRSTPGLAGKGPREEKLRILYRAARRPAEPSEALRRRVALIIAEPNAPRAPGEFGQGRRRLGWAPAARTATAALLFAAISVVVARIGHELATGRPSQTAAKTPLGEHSMPSPRLVPSRQPADPRRRIASGPHTPPRPPDHQRVVPFSSVEDGAKGTTARRHSPFRWVRNVESGMLDKSVPERRFPRADSPSGPPGLGVDDLDFMNRKPANSSLNGALSDQWGSPGARVRPTVQVREDFITIPFPRLATLSNRQVAEAVEGYKREAAIVDPHLAREVTCAFKGMALSDVCDRLCGDTGIQLTAGASVADEKVTVFCEKMPLRDVMRQLSRPFGYTWLRSKKVFGSPAPRVPGCSVLGPNGTPNTEDRTLNTEYRYELVQDLKSQLLEEELRNRDRNAALLDLEKEIDRYRPYLGLSPDEALAQSKAAASNEKKKLLEDYAGWGWGPLQLYARLSPQQQAALRAGRTISFSGDPRRIERDGAQPLPPELERGILQSMRDVRVRRPGSEAAAENRPIIGTPQDLPDGVPPAASPETNGFAFLRIGHSELGQFTLDGGSGVTIGSTITVRGHDLATGVSPAVQDPKNEVVNARLARDPSLQKEVTVAPSGQEHGPDGSPPEPLSRPSNIQTPNGRPKSRIEKVTSAEVLEALHRASGVPIVADFYTHLYPQESVSVKGRTLFETLNHLADAMRLRWNKETGTREAGVWLRFRSMSYYDDRVKEVPNRLLARWAAARRQHGGLPLDDLVEMSQLSDPQLDSSYVGEGVKECWGLDEWGLAHNHQARPHLRYLAQLTPAQRQRAMTPQGLPFSQLSLAQQQGLIAHLGDRLHSLGEVAGASVRVEYSQPGAFRWPSGAMPAPGQPGLFGLARVQAPTREAALAAARVVDPQASEAQVVPTELSLAVVYTLIDPKTGETREQGVRTYGVADNARINW